MILLLGRISPAIEAHIRQSTKREVLSFENEAAAAQVLPDAEIVFAGAGLSGEGISRARSMRMLYSASAGVERLPFDTLRARGIRLANSGGIHGTQMAEQIMGVVIAFDRGLHQCVRYQAARRWAHGAVNAGEIMGKTMLIVGTGKIGQVLAARAAAFGMRVEGVRRTAGMLANFDAIYGMESLHDRLAHAHFVVALMPLTPETENMFDSAAFAAMRPDAYFINYARGGVADEAALADALHRGVIAGAGLDVFRTEPLPPDSPFWDMENVIITPHTAGLTPAYLERAAEVFVRCLAAFDAGEIMPTEVDLERRY